MASGASFVQQPCWCCWTVGQAGGVLGDPTTKAVSTTKPPPYVLNAGKDGLPIAEGKRPSWLVKEDELIIDARWGLLRTTYSCTVADCRPRRNSSTFDRTGRSWIIEMDLVFSKDVFLSLKRCVSLSSSSWLFSTCFEPSVAEETSWTWRHSYCATSIDGCNFHLGAQQGCQAQVPGLGVRFFAFFSLPGSLLRVSHAELRWLRAILATNRNHASNLAGWDVINEPMIHPYTDCSIHCVVFIVLAYSSQNQNVQKAQDLLFLFVSIWVAALPFHNWL